MNKKVSKIQPRSKVWARLWLRNSLRNRQQFDSNKGTVDDRREARQGGSKTHKIDIESLFLSRNWSGRDRPGSSGQATQEPETCKRAGGGKKVGGWVCGAGSVGGADETENEHAPGKCWCWCLQQQLLCYGGAAGRGRTGGWRPATICSTVRRVCSTATERLLFGGRKASILETRETT